MFTDTHKQVVRVKAGGSCPVYNSCRVCVCVCGPYLFGREGGCLILPQHDRVVCQVLVHHLILRVEQQESLSTLYSLCILLT